jgi:hypothetical protein
MPPPTQPQQPAQQPQQSNIANNPYSTSQLAALQSSGGGMMDQKISAGIDRILHSLGQLIKGALAIFSNAMLLKSAKKIAGLLGEALEGYDVSPKPVLRSILKEISQSSDTFFKALKEKLHMQNQNDLKAELSNITDSDLQKKVSSIIESHASEDEKIKDLNRIIESEDKRE